MIRNIFMNLFGNILFGTFLRLGKLFYNSIAVRSDVSACHFAHSDWDMYHSMEEYMNDENYLNTKPKQKKDD